MTDKQMEDMMEDMIDFTAESMASEEEVAKKVELKETISKYKDMLSSREFTRKCKQQAKQYKVSEKHIKNMYALNLLEKMGGTATLGLEVIAEAFNYLIRFIGYVIQKAMDIAIGALCKIVNIITFRREVTA